MEESEICSGVRRRNDHSRAVRGAGGRAEHPQRGLAHVEDYGSARPQRTLDFGLAERRRRTARMEVDDLLTTRRSLRPYRCAHQHDCSGQTRSSKQRPYDGAAAVRTGAVRRSLHAWLSEASASAFLRKSAMSSSMGLRASGGAVSSVPAWKGGCGSYSLMS